ncbi:hypothetical protein V1279_002750 [Bradyrhizobium sp. AZCC 1610]
MLRACLAMEPKGNGSSFLPSWHRPHLAEDPPEIFFEGCTHLVWV